MPTISMFYGIIVWMFFEIGEKHNPPHVHVRYQGMNEVADAQWIQRQIPKNRF